MMKLGAGLMIAAVLSLAVRLEARERAQSSLMDGQVTLRNQSNGSTICDEVYWVTDFYDGDGNWVGSQWDLISVENCREGIPTKINAGASGTK